MLNVMLHYLTNVNQYELHCLFMFWTTFW